MPLSQIGDLNTGRNLADDFILQIARQRDAKGAVQYSVRVSLAVLAGGQAIKSCHLEEIGAQLTGTQRATAANLVEDLLGL